MPNLWLCAAVMATSAYFFPAFAQTGPAAGLDLDAMNALDAKIETLIESHTNKMNIGTLSSPAALPEPFICDLTETLANLDVEQAKTPELTLEHWQNLIDIHKVENLPRNTLTEKCAVYQTLTNLLEVAREESEQCHPLTSALRLAALVPDVPNQDQSEVAAMLEDLTNQHEATRFQDTGMHELCSRYAQVESHILNLVGEGKESTTQ